MQTIPIRNGHNNFLLVGSNTNMLPFRSNINNYPGLTNSVIDPTAFLQTKTFNSMNSAGIRSQMRIKLVPENSAEMGELLNDRFYARYSIMSLDGLLSPVSFYPTPYAATFSITHYNRSDCPFCDGTGSHTYRYVNNNGYSVYNTRTSNTITCPYCIPDADKDKLKEKNVRPGFEMDPPYIITDEDDAQASVEDVLASATDSSAIINQFTLNPIVMREGEYANFNKDDQDTSAHCIEVVAAGLESPKNGASIRGYMSNTSNNYISTYNQRFMALRGPLMLHSWGYDTQGYPIPNASGDYKIQNGVVVTDANGNSIYSTQEQNPDGTWSDPIPSTKFKRGFAQIAHDWPVGPIDLRWDSNACVWTAGNRYKDVWVTIELDMVPNTAIRGVINDDGPSTLANNERKVVFVYDSLGIVSAPRKSKIYCKYNPDNGFYTPIYSSTTVAKGTILSSTSAEITLNSTTYTITYSNPVGLTTNNDTTALFSYINGDWVLTSSK